MSINYVAFFSRITHTVCSALLFTTVAAPFVFTSVGPLENKMLPMYLTGAIVLAGLYNAGAAKPSRITTASGRMTYRMTVYAGKLLFILAASPLLGKLINNAELEAKIRLGVVVGGFVAGAWVKFFREANVPQAPSKDD
eukprot:TRINITY_DN3650_c0_g1_i1.p1 TRINITY_DN3650_c0_g1~~TRINITY_DN3650_c0_g1_i1.p1  ORF type:complete len:158 (+),score=65.87 TRINITY_DN3650_c0_g1_i1:59-475(+)